MNGEHHHPTAGGNLFWPSFLFVLAFDVFLMVQIHSRWNILSNLMNQQKTIIQQAHDMQNQVAAARTMVMMAGGLAQDILQLSNTDSDVRRMVDKYKSMGITITPPTVGVSTNK